MNNKVFLFLCIGLLLISCKSISHKKNATKYNVEAIKFMGTITTQSTTVSEKNFWGYKEEHVKLNIKNNYIFDAVKKLTDNSKENFNGINYAFISETYKDTLYSDSTLKSWILKNKEKTIYYYDEDGVIAEKLRSYYSFFYDCW